MTGPAAQGVPLPDVLRQALTLHRAGRLAEAEALYRAILAAVPDQFDALHMLGVLAIQRGALDEGVRQIERALRVMPQSAPALGNLANVLRRLQRHEEALSACERSLALQPNDAGVLNTQGLARFALGRTAEALASYDRALAVAPRDAIVLTNRGNALASLGRDAEALASHDAAIAVQPGFAEAFRNRGNVLRKLRRLREALASYERALALGGEGAAALHGLRAEVLRDLGLHEAAVAACTQSLELQADQAAALEMRGHCLHYLGRNEEAARDFERALAVSPDRTFALSMLLLLRGYNADWRDADALRQRLTDAVHRDAGGVEPFVFVVESDSAEDQLRCAQAAAGRFVPAAAPLWRGERYGHSRLRVAYLSPDFREHATSYLLAEVLERHDRERFEIVGLSWCAEEATPMRARIKRAFDTFVDVQQWHDDAVAQWLREREIDLVVDLAGYTNGARPGICARRPAPVQVNFLGYPGTLGSANYDYIVADATVVPQGDRHCYAEKVAYLPDCYQPNDRQRPVAANSAAREACGLPADGFVFCCFNATYKIAPAVFAVWMRLLQRVEGSVLWLLEGTASARANLRRAAESRDVAAERLVFAPRMALADHLARHRHAHLFLDTLPCNAHTTASDALWAGVPVLTCLGTTFAGRVAGSLVRAAGLPELAVASLAEYEELAVRLACDREALATLRDALVGQRLSCPLFDTDRYRRNLEAAFAQMTARARSGLPAEAFAVAPGA